VTERPPARCDEPLGHVPRLGERAMQPSAYTSARVDDALAARLFGDMSPGVPMSCKQVCR
jgi:hypothetical protein